MSGCPHTPPTGPEPTDPARTPHAEQPTERSAAKGVSRRGLLGRLGLVGAGALVAGSGVAVAVAQRADAFGRDPVAGSDVVPFVDGTHQAGIATPSPSRLALAAFDVVGDAGSLRSTLSRWTAAARAMCAGDQVPGSAGGEFAAPADTGEAVGTSASNLTITVGYGPGLFSTRNGLAGKGPAHLAELPPLPHETLQPAYGGGAVVVQACTDDPQVAFHAVRNLSRIASGTLALRWLQQGFGRTSSTTAGQATERNLMGFKDGIRNVRAEDTATADRWVWAGSESGQDWMTGGSFLVVRRIRMQLEQWDRDTLGDQEKVFGRTKAEGAPMGAAQEFDTPDFRATGTDGKLIIPLDSHIRLAAPENNGGMHILRRGFSYTDAVDQRTLLLDSGLLFLAYMRDPAQFVQLQRVLGRSDALNEYVLHVGSAVFACPRGLRTGEDWSSQLYG